MAEFEAAFRSKGNFTFKEPEALERCQQLAEELGLTAEQIAIQYDVYAVSK